MNEAGYTLVETMAALAALGLATSGLAMGVQVIAREHATANALVTEASDRRRAQAALERLLGPFGPFRSHEPQRFAGNEEQFVFDCGQEVPCRVAWIDTARGLELEIRSHDSVLRTPLHAKAPARFVYESEMETTVVWPSARPERLHLRSVRLTSLTRPDEPLLTTRIWVEQPVVCEFDTVLRDCR